MASGRAGRAACTGDSAAAGAQLAGQRVIYSYPGLTPPRALLWAVRRARPSLPGRDRHRRQARTVVAGGLYGPRPDPGPSGLRTAAAAGSGKKRQPGPGKASAGPRESVSRVLGKASPGPGKASAGPGESVSRVLGKASAGSGESVSRVLGQPGQPVCGRSDRPVNPAVARRPGRARPVHARSRTPPRGPGRADPACPGCARRAS